MVAWWWTLLGGAVLSGLWIWPHWRDHRPAPPQSVLLLHGGFAGLLLATLAMVYRREGPWSNPEVAVTVLVIASGAMLFSARHRMSSFPRGALGAHVLGVVGLLVLSVLLALPS